MSIPQSSIMASNVFAQKGGKLEKCQSLAKMRQITPNWVSNFKIAM